MLLDDAQHFLFLLIQGYSVHSLRDQRDENVTCYYNGKFPKLLSIVLSNDHTLLHQGYCPGQNEKYRFLYFLSPCTYSKQP